MASNVEKISWKKKREMDKSGEKTDPIILIM